MRASYRAMGRGPYCNFLNMYINFIIFSSSECLSLKIPEWNENSDHPPREIKAETVKDSTVWDKDTIAKTNSANGWPPMNVSTDLCIQYVKSQDIIDR